MDVCMNPKGKACVLQLHVVCQANGQSVWALRLRLWAAVKLAGVTLTYLEMVLL